MPKLSPTNFDPEMVSMMRSVLDAAVDQIERQSDASDKSKNGRNNFAGCF